MQVVAYTDGSSRGGPAGWAVLLDDRLYSDWIEWATNNEAEMYAILQAVMLCPSGVELAIYTDSKCCIGWLCWSWRIRNPRIASMVRAYFAVVDAKQLIVRLYHVKGHSGDKGNETVDRAAYAQAGIALALRR